MLNKFRLFILLFFIQIGSPGRVFAADRITGNDSQGCVVLAGGVPSLGCLSQVIANIISVAFIFLGATCLVFLLLGAIKYIFSQGDPKAIQKAKGTITYAIMGTVFVALSFLIVETLAHLLGFPSFLNGFTVYQGP